MDCYNNINRHKDVPPLESDMRIETETWVILALVLGGMLGIIASIDYMEGGFTKALVRVIQLYLS
jgi:hypothetical protein